MTPARISIDYLAIEKLRVKTPEPGRLDSKREALVGGRCAALRARPRRAPPDAAAGWSPTASPPDHASRLPHTAASILARIPGRTRARRRRPALFGVAAAAVAGVALVLTLGGSDDARGVPVTVFNAEAACRSSPSDDCRLGLAGDPYAKYAPANIVDRVRHGDRLFADCYVAGARTVPPRTAATATAGTACARQPARRGCPRFGSNPARVRRFPAAHSPCIQGRERKRL